MQRKTPGLAVFLVAAGLAGAASWWWLQGDDAPLPVDAPGAGASPGLPGEAVPAAPAAPGAPAADARPHVHVAVRVVERFVPPPPVLLQCQRAGDGRELPHRLLAGAGAGPGDEPPRAGMALVAISLPDGGTAHRQLAVDPAAVARVVVGAPAPVRVRVVDGKGLPRAGAVVWLGETEADGRRREATSDAEGAAVLAAAAGTGVPCVLSAPGCRSQQRWLDLRAEGVDVAFTLAPATRLDVQLVGEVPEPQLARLFVLPSGQVSTELAEYPFASLTIAGGVAFGADGRASLADLPPEATVEVLVVHPHFALGRPRPVVLRGTAVRELVPLGKASPTWRGAVVDDAGAPVAGAVLIALAGGRLPRFAASLRFAPGFAQAAPALLAASAADGSFAIGWPGADARLFARAPQHAGRDLPLPGPLSAPVVLPRWRGGEPSFVLAPPVPGQPWRASCDLAGGVAAELAADQPWIVSLPHAGRFDFALATRRLDQPLAEQAFPGLDATGPIELPPPGGR